MSLSFADHARDGFFALMIRFQPANRSTSGSSRRSRRGTSSGEIWRWTIWISVNAAKQRAQPGFRVNLHQRTGIVARALD